MAKQELYNYARSICHDMSMAESNKSQPPRISRLLSATDSLDLINENRASKNVHEEEAVCEISETRYHSQSSNKLVQPLSIERTHQLSDRNVKIKADRYRTSSIQHETRQSVNLPENKDNLVALQLRSDEYMRTLQREPKYMRPTSASPLKHLSLWKYKVTTQEEWDELQAKIEKSLMDSRSEKRVRVDDTESLLIAAVPVSSVGASESSMAHPQKSILRHVDGTSKPATHDRFRVASLLQRLERSNEIVDMMTRQFN